MEVGAGTIDILRFGSERRGRRRHRIRIEIAVSEGRKYVDSNLCGFRGLMPHPVRRCPMTGKLVLKQA
jgi:hypothetical protein